MAGEQLERGHDTEELMLHLSNVRQDVSARGLSVAVS